MTAPLAEAPVGQVTGITFNSDESGFAYIRVNTTDPVPFDTAWQTDTQLDLILYTPGFPHVFRDHCQLYIPELRLTALCRIPALLITKMQKLKYASGKRCLIG